MSRNLRVAPALILIAVAFAGCVGDDKAPLESGPEGAAAAQATAAAGSITGQIITVNLEVLVGLEVGLTNRTGALTLTSTDTQGRYTFNDITPGQYRIQVTDACCKVRAVNVNVVAGHVSEINLQLERLSSTELRTPYVVSKQWNGFLACGVSAASPSDDRCAIADANHDVQHLFNVTEGLEEMAIGMDWTPNAQGVGEDMRLTLTNRNCSGCGERYILIAGPPPLVAKVTSGTANNPDARFDAINGTMEMRYTVGPSGVAFAYQQDFTLYWHEFYNQAAPMDFNPLADG